MARLKMGAVVIQHVLKEVLEGINCEVVGWVIEQSKGRFDLHLVFDLPLNRVRLVASGVVSINFVYRVKFCKERFSFVKWQTGCRLNTKSQVFAVEENYQVCQGEKVSVTRSRFR